MLTIFGEVAVIMCLVHELSAHSIDRMLQLCGF